MGLTERSFLERMELMGLTESRAVTNADRIRAMTDEELANFIGGIFTTERDVWGNYDPHMVVTQEPRVEIRDYSEMIRWLKEKVTE